MDFKLSKVVSSLSGEITALKDELAAVREKNESIRKIVIFKWVGSLRCLSAKARGITGGSHHPELPLLLRIH